jgi:hypothetical protein
LVYNTILYEVSRIKNNKKNKKMEKFDGNQIDKAG